MKKLLWIPLLFLCSTLWAADELVQLARMNPYIAGVTVAAFNRANIASLVAWYKADQATCAAACGDGDAITGWPDSKGTYDLTTSGNYPLYKTNQQNGKPTILFYPGKSLDIGGSSAIGTAYTIWFVFNSMATGQENLISSSGNGGFIVRQNVDTQYIEVDSYATAEIVTSSSAIASSAYHTLIVTFQDASNGNTSEIFYDGASIGADNSHGVTLGAGGGVFLFNSQNWYLGEVGICSAALSSGDVASLQAALKADWATP